MRLLLFCRIFLRRLIGVQDKLSFALRALTLFLFLLSPALLPQQISLRAQGESWAANISLGGAVSTLLAIALVGFMAGESWLESAVARLRIEGIYADQESGRFLMRLYNYGLRRASDVRVYIQETISTHEDSPCPVHLLPFEVKALHGIEVDARMHRVVDLFASFLKDRQMPGLICYGTDARGVSDSVCLVMEAGSEIRFKVYITMGGSRQLEQWFLAVPFSGPPNPAAKLHCSIIKTGRTG